MEIMYKFANQYYPYILLILIKVALLKICSLDTLSFSLFISLR